MSVCGPYDNYFDPRTRDGCCKEYVTFLIGKKRDTVDYLKQALETGDRFKTGILLGYPASAVRAALGQSERYMRDGALCDQGILIPDCPFTEFIFSGERREVEFISTSKRWCETVKRLSPDIFSELLAL
jgi:hypothetical protein